MAHDLILGHKYENLYMDIRPSTSEPRLDPRPCRSYILDLRPSDHFTF